MKDEIDEILIDYRNVLTQQMGLILAGKHRLDIKTADKILLDEAKQAILALKKKWLIEELTILGDKLYDITDIDWGIPTKWSIEQFNKEHADLWIPQKAVDLLISNRIKALNGDK